MSAVGIGRTPSPPVLVVGADLWLDAYDLALADNAAVTSWTNKGTAGGVASQATGSKQPLYKATGMNGRPCVRFDGVDDLLVSTTASATQKPFTVFAVVNRTVEGSPTVDTILGSTVNAGIVFRAETNGALKLVSQNTANITTTNAAALTGGTPAIVSVSWDTDGTSVYAVNGRPIYSNLIQRTLSGAGLVSVGGCATGAVDPFIGDIASVVRFPRLLTGWEMNRVVKMLADKWGITLSTRLGTGSHLSPPAGRMRGSNVHPRSADSSHPSGDTWAGLWVNWDWDGYVKPCIDKAITQGARVVRIIGSIKAVSGGYMTQATYTAQQQQVAQYCQDNGVYYYPSGGDLRNSTGVASATIQSQIVAQAAALAGYSLFGMDVLQELGSGYTASGWTEATAVAFAQTLLTAVKAAAPALPLTCSNIGVQNTGFNELVERIADYPRRAALDAYVDFYDEHLYSNSSGATQNVYCLTPYFMYSDKPLVCGEVGFDVTAGGQTEATVAAKYEVIRQATISQPVHAVVQWAIQADSYGLYSGAGVERTTITAQWAKQPG